jgi:hypothetical protein
MESFHVVLFIKIFIKIFIIDFLFLSEGTRSKEAFEASQCSKALDALQDGRYLGKQDINHTKR